MTVGQLSGAEIVQRLFGPGLGIRTGAFSARIRSDAPGVGEGIRLLYEHYPVVGDDSFCDFTLDLWRPRSLRRWVRPQVRFYFDGAPAFEPLPLDHAFALLEWAMNWCISTHSHQYLILHAAAIERGGFAAVLPAPPGSGKSTLCAALIHRGWRLLSDEMALISLRDSTLHALARPVSLKNQSLDVIQRFAPGAVFNAPAYDTSKGTVAHMRVPQSHVDRVAEAARPGWVVFPRFLPGAAATLIAREKSEAMMTLCDNAFNYGVLGRRAFESLAELVTASECFDFSYGSLQDAVEVFDVMAGRR